MDTVSKQKRSEIMSSVKGFNTKPEYKVRKLLHGLGFRYRLHSHKLPGRPDLIFSKRKKIIFVHGCFWHRHPNCKHARIPKSKVAYWTNKLQNNAIRDKSNIEKLQQLGWKTFVVWECELNQIDKLKTSLIHFLET